MPGSGTPRGKWPRKRTGQGEDGERLMVNQKVFCRVGYTVFTGNLLEDLVTIMSILFTFLKFILTVGEGMDCG